MRPILLLLLALALPTPAQVYKWTDPSGKTHYGDKPPADAKKQELKISIPSYEGPVEVRNWGEVLRRPPPASARGLAAVTMYSTQSCGHCRNARAYFASQGVRYTEIDVEASEEGHKRFKELGGRGVPLIVVGDKVMRGFSAERFDKLYRGT